MTRSASQRPSRAGNALCTVLTLTLCGCAGARAPSPPVHTTGAASEPNAIRQGFRPALAGYRFRFPKDAGAHPGYKTEWWYYTGHLSGAGGEYGFELTFFRVQLLPHPLHRASRWATNVVYLAHFALTDIRGRRFHFDEGSDRGSLGAAGAATGREQVWIGDWSAAQLAPPGREARDAAVWPHTLRASAQFGTITLKLRPLTPPVIEGTDGISRKGPGYGQASHYYSYPRLVVSGWLSAGGHRSTVAGLAWMDHEFGSSQLGRGTSGWDWFSVQLNNGWEMMLYQLRLTPGSACAGAPRVSPYSSGTVIGPEGQSRTLTARQFRVRALGQWTSPASGACYPSGWELREPSAGLVLQEQPVLRDQELRTAGSTGLNYWEGAVTVRGTQNGKPVSGEGYTELTGYGAPVTQLR